MGDEFEWSIGRLYCKEFIVRNPNTQKKGGIPRKMCSVVIDKKGKYSSADFKAMIEEN